VPTDFVHSLQDGSTPLHVAACWGQIHVIEYLLHNGAVKEARDEVGGKHIKANRY
jgi:ankyrin repeat protein